MPVTLSIKKAVELINSGYVRWTKDEITPTESLQTYFGLNTKQMQTLLKRPELKNKRTTDNSLIFEEDIVTDEVPNLNGSVLVSDSNVSTSTEEVTNETLVNRSESLFN